MTAPRRPSLSVILLAFVVAACLVVSTQGALLNTFSVAGYSAQWAAYNGYATNLLPANNPSASTSIFWNSGADWGVYPQPYWVSFDLGSAQWVLAFEYKAVGDTTHDPASFDLQYSSSSGGPWTTAQSYSGQAGSAMQVFPLTTPVNARFWRFYIYNTHSPYQAYVAYVNFVVPSSGCAPWDGTSAIASGAHAQFWNPSTGLWMATGSLPVGSHPAGLVFGTNPVTFTLNSVSSFTYFSSSGQQAALYDPSGNQYSGDWGGNFIVKAGQYPPDHWNIAWAPSSTAGQVTLAVAQAYNPPANFGWNVGLSSENGVWLPNLATGGVPITYYDFELFIC